VPFIVNWPGRVQPGVSDAIVGQVDLTASLGALTGRPLRHDEAPDSLDVLGALLGESPRGRDHVVEHAGGLALRQGEWKYIEPGGGRGNRKNESGTAPRAQLYHLKTDPGEANDVAAAHPDRVSDMAALLRTLRESRRTRE
jgi:arylsulfatase A-like enzyme